MITTVVGQKGGGHTPTEHANTLFSTSTARVIDLICEGPIEGFVTPDHPEQSVYFDNVPMMEADRITGIASVVAADRKYTFAGAIPSAFAVGRSIRVSGCTNAGNNGDFTIEKVSAASITPGFITVAKSGTTKWVNESPAGTSSVAIMNFKGATVEARFGAPSQTPLSGFSEVESEVTVGRDLKFGAAIDVVITDQNVDAIKIPIRFQALQRTNDDGDGVGDTVNFTFYRRWAGGSFVQFDTREVKGKTNSEYEIQWRYGIRSEPFLQGLTAGDFPLTIKIERNTPESERTSRVNACSVPSITQVYETKLEYPNTTVVGITVNSELFGGRVPDRSYFIKGLQIKYPTGYDPETQTYPDFWDGTFTTGWCDNPAWVFYDILTNPRYGLGEFISEAQVDKTALYQIAKYCDCWVDGSPSGSQVLISDGFGGYERRFVFNGVIESREEAFTVLNSIASTFRGMAFWSAGGVTASQDRPKETTRLVTRANVVDGDFSYSGTALKARHTAALVTWNDPEDNYKQAVEVVEDQDLVVRYGWRPAEVVAFATTSRGQAHRDGRWLLDTERYSDETVTFTSGVEFQDARPGEIIEISDPARTGQRRGGRVQSFTATGFGVVGIDMPYTTVAGDVLLVVNAQDVVEELPVQAGTTGTDIVLTEAPTGTIQADSIYIIQSNTLATEKWQIVSIREAEPHKFEVTALSYDDTKFARVEQNLTLATAPTSFIPTGKLTPPTNLSVVERLVRKNSNISTVLDVSWTASTDPRTLLYQFEFRPPNGEWSSPTFTSGLSVQLQDVAASYTEDGTDYNWEFRVRGQKTYYAAAGQSDPLELFDVVVVGKTAPPPNVENFTAVRTYRETILKWDAVDDIDLAGYDIQSGSDVWDQAGNVTVATSHLSNTITVPTTDTATTRYLIRARDTLGNLSVVATAVTAQFPTIAAPVSLRAYQLGSSVRLIWDKASGSELSDFEIRIGTTTTSWQDAQQIGTTSDTQFVFPVSVAVNTVFRFHVRTYYQISSGQRAYSAAQTVDINKWPMVGANITFTREEHTLGWPGTLSSEMEIVSGELALRDTETSGTYRYTIDVGSSGVANVLNNFTDVLDFWSNLSGKIGRLFRRDESYLESISGLKIYDATMKIYDAEFPITAVASPTGQSNIRFYLELSPDVEFLEADYQINTVTIRIEFTRQAQDDFRPVLSTLTTYFHEPTEMQ
jgi:predicted phage tail protein